MANTTQINQILLALDQHIGSLMTIKSDLEAIFMAEDDIEESQSFTLEDVRAVLAEKSRLGFTKDIKQIILDLGATKLSEVKESDYALLLKKTEVLGND